MISEKTVELNLTTELVNYLFSKTTVRPYILAPSQREEGVLGFDTAVGYPGSANPHLIQYKRAYFKSRSNELEYLLNRNASRDQHLRLYCLELMGWDVWYALPLFYQPSEVIGKRRGLLVETLYVRPSALSPIGSWTGQHEVRYNLTTGTLTVHSEEGKLVEEVYEFDNFIESVSKKTKLRELKEIVEEYNGVFNNRQTLKVEDHTLEPVTEEDESIVKGQCLFALY